MPAELKITSIVRAENGHIVLQGLGVPNQLNTIQFSPDLVTEFGFLDTVTPDAIGFFEYTDTEVDENTAKRFYRLTFP